MRTECLQRELADSIVRMEPLDSLRLLLAGGARANEPVTEQGLRPLHYAVWQRYPAAATLLLVRGGDVNARDDCGYSALHLAAEHGYLELVSLLLQQGARVDYREPTDEPFPRTTLCDEPLRLAIRNRHADVARLLLEHGADPNKRYFFGSEINLVSPLDTHFLQLLLSFGADPNSRDRAGLTPLMKAARLPQGMESVLLLLSFGADVNAMTDSRHDYRSVLHYAVLSGNAATVKLLLKQGASPSAAQGLGLPGASPLHLAVLRGDPELAGILIEAGADVNACCPVVGSALHVALSEGVPRAGELTKLLLKAGADPNVLAEDVRPVLPEYIATSRQLRPELVALLLAHGAKVVMKTQFRDPQGMLNCLHGLAERGPPFLFELLAGAAEGFDRCMIRRQAALSEPQRQRLLQLANEPLSLRSQIRLFLRRFLGRRLPDVADKLGLPHMLVSYLLYQLP